MKKYIIIVIGLVLIGALILVLALSFSGGDTSSPQTTTTTESQTTEATTIPIEDLMRPIRPEEVELMPAERVDADLWLDFIPSFRTAFYVVEGALDGLVHYELVNEWAENFRNNRPQEEDFEEMFMLSFIKYFNLSRTDVAQAFTGGRQSNSEEFEHPNVDLVFTFNSDLINRYYSRDLVVAQAAYDELQEWLQNNEPYESYSAFRAANP